MYSNVEDTDVYSYLINSTKNYQDTEYKPFIAVTFLSRKKSNPNNRIIECMESLYSTAQDPFCVEVLVRIDDDDDLMYYLNVKKIFEERLNIRFLIGKRGNGYPDSNKMLSELFDLFSPSVTSVIMITDDSLFLKSGWDSAFIEGFKTYADGYFFVNLGRAFTLPYNDFDLFFVFLWKWGPVSHTPACTVKTLRKIQESLSGKPDDWTPTGNTLLIDSFFEVLQYYMCSFLGGKYLIDIPNTVKIQEDIVIPEHKKGDRWAIPVAKEHFEKLITEESLAVMNSIAKSICDDITQKHLNTYMIENISVSIVYIMSDLVGIDELQKIFQSLYNQKYPKYLMECFFIIEEITDQAIGYIEKERLNNNFFNIKFSIVILNKNENLSLAFYKILDSISNKFILFFSEIVVMDPSLLYLHNIIYNSRGEGTIGIFGETAYEDSVLGDPFSFVLIAHRFRFGTKHLLPERFYFFKEIFLNNLFIEKKQIIRVFSDRVGFSNVDIMLSILSNYITIKVLFYSDLIKSICIKPYNLKKWRRKSFQNGYNNLSFFSEGLLDKYKTASIEELLSLKNNLDGLNDIMNQLDEMVSMIQKGLLNRSVEIPLPTGQVFQYPEEKEELLIATISTLNDYDTLRGFISSKSL